MPENVFLHSASKLYRAALKLSACCSIESLTIFQKHSETDKERLFVDIWDARSAPDLNNTQSEQMLID